MTILENIRQPHDPKALPETRLGEPSQESGGFLAHAAARAGDRLGSDLGAVEPTVALHRVFESPVDRILWDTGHRSHVHGLLTARQDFSGPRGEGGPSACPSREESEHDVIENSHASTAIDAVDRVGGLHVPHRAASPEVLPGPVGVTAPVCLQGAELLGARGIVCTVVGRRWVEPVDAALPRLAAGHRLVAVVVDDSRAGGAGSTVASAPGDADIDGPVRRFGTPDQFPPHAEPGEVHAGIGLTPVEVAGRISGSLAVREDIGHQPQHAQEHHA